MKRLLLTRRLRYKEFVETKDSKEMLSMNQSSDELPSPRGGVPPLSKYRQDTVFEMRRPGTCIPNICGKEAACKPHQDNTYTCVCPQDTSPPTEELKCPNRNTVPVKPHPIRNIIPPVGGFGPNNTSANAQQPASTSIETKEITTLPPQPESSIPQPSPAVHDLRILAGLAAGSLLILVLCLMICCWKRRQLTRCGGKSEKTKGTTSCTPSPMILKKSILVADRYTLNPQYTACSTTAPSPSVPLLRAETLRFLHEIGEGCFGKVFKGELQRDIDTSEDYEIVAIKVLKESASREAEDDFMREVDIMSAFRHPNILSLIGVVPRESGMSPMMVFEYMPHGDLAEVLRSNARYCGSKPPASPGVDSPTLAPRLDAKALLSVALQIAAGMRYLAAQRFVHRDLACRNCLVAQGPVVKIADFGMSRDVYTCDYYKIGGSRLLPVRWMSPESVMYGRFTLESDIWSYGIVLWEIYSFGKQPYYGHTNEEVVKLILQGIMLIPPEDCPTLIYDLMRSCWKTEPRDRIRFPDIYEKLEKAYDNFQISETVSNLSTVLNIEPNKSNVTLPRPPVLPIAQLDNILDTDGYLLPQETTRANYLQTLPD